MIALMMAAALAHEAGWVCSYTAKDSKTPLMVKYAVRGDQLVAEQDSFRKAVNIKGEAWRIVVNNATGLIAVHAHARPDNGPNVGYGVVAIEKASGKARRNEADLENGLEDELGPIDQPGVCKAY